MLYSKWFYKLKDIAQSLTFIFLILLWSGQIIQTFGVLEHYYDIIGLGNAYLVAYQGILLLFKTKLVTF